eukprot:jgi/Chlat1/7205/Chrsp57S06853
MAEAAAEAAEAVQLRDGMAGDTDGDSEEEDTSVAPRRSRRQSAEAVRFHSLSDETKQVLREYYVIITHREWEGAWRYRCRPELLQLVKEHRTITNSELRADMELGFGTCTQAIKCLRKVLEHKADRDRLISRRGNTAKAANMQLHNHQAPSPQQQEHPTAQTANNTLHPLLSKQTGGRKRARNAEGHAAGRRSSQQISANSAGVVYNDTGDGDNHDDNAGLNRSVDDFLQHTHAFVDALRNDYKQQLQSQTKMRADKDAELQQLRAKYDEAVCEQEAALQELERAKEQTELKEQELKKRKDLHCQDQVKFTEERVTISMLSDKKDEALQATFTFLQDIQHPSQSALLKLVTEALSTVDKG